MEDVKENFVKTPILPLNTTFLNEKKGSIEPWAFDSKKILDKKAICYFVSTGFFPNDTTYYKEVKVVPPATSFNPGNVDNQRENYWKWHYSPRDISFKQAVEEFAHLFEKITNEQVKGKRVILPLSGGLDSRSQAAALSGHKEVFAYSYQFQGGIKENFYGKEIAKVQKFTYQDFNIQPSYLWSVIEQLADINKCFSEFTHPRQMAVHHLFDQMGDIFYLGHWGDVFFDDMGVPAEMTNDELVKIIYKKIIKKGGLEIGESLWEAWGISGNFEDSLKEMILTSLSEINVDNANARLRAYKSLQWAPRWTSNNLSVFEDKHPLALPYYHEDMCKFICTVPEEYLSARKIQIEYIKIKAPKLARIPWQTYDPCNLYNYDKFNSLSSIMVRSGRKMQNAVRTHLRQKPLILRNWEIQFLGKENENFLKSYLFENESFQDLLPKDLVTNFYNKFNEKDKVWYSHPVSMLLTLSLFSKRHFGSNTI